MRQHRETRQRQIVLEAVRRRSDHPTADQVYLEARSLDEKISRGTVYRNLNSLSEDGEIRHIKIPGADRYDLRVDVHDHLLCTECGAVCDVSFSHETRNDAMLEQETGYSVVRHCTVYLGICPDCQKKSGAKA